MHLVAQSLRKIKTFYIAIMNKLKLLTTLALYCFIATASLAQTIADGYNPFVPANLNDETKLQVNSVVESSYHRYWINGDDKYTEVSNFIWYVENGEFGTYDPNTDNWIALTPGGSISNGYYIQRSGTTVEGVANSSEIWVKWNDGTQGNVGYIAAYEISSNSCIVDQMIQGFKHNILAPPEVWFAEATRQECSESAYTVEIHFNNANDLSYPYTVRYTRPDNNGLIVEDTLVVAQGELTAASTYFLDFELVHDRDVAIDETYNITLIELRDKYGSTGKIAPLGAAQNQYAAIELKVLHLPQTQQMKMQ